jgi:hypothetical protein
MSSGFSLANQREINQHIDSLIDEWIVSSSVNPAAVSEIMNLIESGAPYDYRSCLSEGLSKSDYEKEYTIIENAFKTCAEFLAGIGGVKERKFMIEMGKRFDFSAQQWGNIMVSAVRSIAPHKHTTAEDDIFFLDNLFEIIQKKSAHFDFSFDNNNLMSTAVYNKNTQHVVDFLSEKGLHFGGRCFNHLFIRNHNNLFAINHVWCLLQASEFDSTIYGTLSDFKHHLFDILAQGFEVLPGFDNRPIADFIVSHSFFDLHWTELASRQEKASHYMQLATMSAEVKKNPLLTHHCLVQAGYLIDDYTELKLITEHYQIRSKELDLIFLKKHLDNTLPTIETEFSEQRKTPKI